MVAIVFLGIFGLIALTFWALTFLSRGHFRMDRTDVPKARVFAPIAGAFTVIFALIFVFNSANYAEARTVGIVTEFGKPVGTVNPGLNWLAPYADVTYFPTSNQNLDLDGTDGQGTPVSVKFQGGGSGNVNVNINWQVENDGKAQQLWANWKDFERVTNDVVNPRVQSKVAEVFGTYTPENAVKGDMLADIDTKIKDELNKSFAKDGIQVEMVAVKRVDPSPEIQDRINKQVQAEADVKRSEIEQQRAKVDNDTNKLREQSLTPQALTNRCLDIVNSWDKNKNGDLPSTFNCGMGSNGQLLVGVK